ncbi:MAG: hypothetical protein ABIK94_05610 [candidate division WOR-3 bacterium]
MIILLFLSLYIYNPNHWLHLPATDEIISITNSLSEVYLIFPEGILVFDRRELKLKNTLTRVDGLPERIKIGGYDQFSGSLVIISEGLLTFFQPFVRIKTDYPLNIQPHSIGMGEKNLCLLTKNERYIWDRKKNKLKKVKAFPDTSIFWYGENTSVKVRDYIFLTPYQVMDEDLNIYPMNLAFPEGKRLWVGVKNYGILVYDRNTGQKIKEFRLGLKAKEIREILKREDGLWLLGNDFFIRLEEDFEKWEYFTLRPGKIFLEKNPLFSNKLLDHLRKEGITALAGEKEISFATPDKFYIFEPKTEELKEISLPGIQKIFPFHDTIFLLTANGLFSYAKATDELTEIVDPKGELKFGVFGMAVNNFGKIFAVRGGFYKLDNSGNWEKFTIPGIDLSKPIRDLAAREDYLFLATEEGLFALNQKDNRYQIIKEKEGLFSSQIRSLYLDSDYLWIASDKGLSRLIYKKIF